MKPARAARALGCCGAFALFLLAAGPTTEAGAAGRKSAAGAARMNPATVAAPADPAEERERIEQEAIRLRAAVARNPRDEPARQRLAELALLAARGLERALSRGDEALVRAYREQIETRFHDTRWRLGRMADRGDGAAAFALGALALHGILAPRKLEEACAHFAAAVAHGFAGAKFRHSQCIEERDPERAALLLREAADGGHLGALERVARLCLDAAPPDGACATARLQRAAREGSASAAAVLGWMHAEGVGVPVDLPRAAALYGEAAGRGDASATNNLGEMLEHGRGLARDEPAAFEHYRRAAEAGFAPAQFNLGRLYAAGRGTARDVAAARRWLEAAQKAGVRRAAQILELLEREAR